MSVLSGLGAKTLDPSRCLFCIKILKGSEGLPDWATLGCRLLCVHSPTVSLISGNYSPEDAAHRPTYVVCRGQFKISTCYPE